MKPNTSKINPWLRLNLIYLPIGLVAGLMVFLISSAFKDSWHLKYLMYSMTFGTCISVSITNCILLANRLFLNWEDTSWRTFSLYFLTCTIAMIIGVETAYLILYWLYDFYPPFPHWDDYLFNLIIVLGICSMLYAINYRKAREESILKEKELDLVKLKQLNTQVELDALQAKINPHFLYNALNSIAALIKDDPKQAEAMTLKLSTLFRYSINSNQESLITVQEELEIVNTYLAIEKIRFGNRIQFIYEVDDALLSCKIPRFLLQPLAENALKHGLKDRPNGGVLCIKIGPSEEGKFFVAIEDNGSAFPEELMVGYGLQSTYDKLALLFGTEANIRLMNEPNKAVYIEIPLKND